MREPGALERNAFREVDFTDCCTAIPYWANRQRAYQALGSWANGRMAPFAIQPSARTSMHTHLTVSARRVNVVAVRGIDRFQAYRCIQTAHSMQVYRPLHAFVWHASHDCVHLCAYLHIH